MTNLTSCPLKKWTARPKIDPWGILIMEYSSPVYKFLRKCL